MVLLAGGLGPQAGATNARQRLSSAKPQVNPDQERTCDPHGCGKCGAPYGTAAAREALLLLECRARTPQLCSPAQGCLNPLLQISPAQPARIGCSRRFSLGFLASWPKCRAVPCASLDGLIEPPTTA